MKCCAILGTMSFGSEFRNNAAGPLPGHIVAHVWRAF